jgi:GT2 family glycosyltransferase
VGAALHGRGDNSGVTVHSPVVLASIVNYRTADLAVECLRSLKLELAAHPGSRAIVVDNDSGDGSADRIAQAIAREGWSAWAEVLASPLNGGFAAGNNMAWRAALESGMRPGFLWLVNPDALVRPGTLQRLLDFAATQPKAGILGGAIEHADGTPWSRAFRFPSLASELDDGLRLGLVSHWLSHKALMHPMGEQPQSVDWICGANFMIRAELIRDIGPMDERYFLYWEETDYCHRAAKAGWSCWYVPDAPVMHLVGQSTGVTNSGGQRPRRRPDYWFESRRHYFVSQHGRGYAAAVDLAWLLTYPIWRLRRALQRKPSQEPPWLWWDLLRHSVLLNPWRPAPTPRTATA